MTIREILLFAKNKKKIIEVEILLCFCLKVDKTFLIINKDFEVQEEIYKKFKLLFDKVLEGYPIAYIVQKKEFYGRDFYVDERVLIPRPETECLIEQVLRTQSSELSKFSIPHSTFYILDIATGSGCIGITLALELIGKHDFKRENLKVFLTDISADALDVCKVNVDKYGLADVCTVLQSDLFEVFFKMINPYFDISHDLDKLSNISFPVDIVTANLPYVSSMNKKNIHKNVERYEPHLALFGGEDGLDLYRKFIKHLTVIKPKVCVFEFGLGQKRKIALELKSSLEAYQQNFYKDLSGIWRGCRIECS